MESTSLFLSSSLIYQPLHKLNLESSKRVRFRPSRTRVFAAVGRDQAHGHDQSYNNACGRLVDVNMIVLRKRIHEMKMVERNYEPPSDWMEWEKQYFASYDSLICEMAGVLQSLLMNTRPGFALGMMGLIALSVPVSSAMVLSHFLEMAKMVMDGINHLT
ncbi:uncharacterized protein LOC8266525 [Ricinus communis]|uniref:Uncharacterized protein n=1 Tax=Ricinus communis TaxID=3988 RepID=B9SKT1_RICCO|nr:uncharacterized protein LOC8266525 [Ricinus communis]EEF35759.1 conserved hypothetical protein [Ricinus communis]|eukprot:XP_002526600.1 uncharacterized protein LOC8266525 [Ricinus communis]